MSLNDEERQIMVKLEYEKAERFFAQAEKNVTIKEWDVVANRIYYSIFHAVVALLIHDRHKVGTHKGAVMMFGQHYVRTGLFSADMGRLYSQLQTMREKADYNCDWYSTEDIIMPMKEKAKQMLLAIKEHIKDVLEK